MKWASIHFSYGEFRGGAWRVVSTWKQPAQPWPSSWIPAFWIVADGGDWVLYAEIR